MSEELNIGEAFPEGDAGGEWAVLLGMAMNDLASLDGQIHDALKDESDNSAGFYFRLLCSALREIWWLFDVAKSDADVSRLVNEMAEEAGQALVELQGFFVRPEPTEDNPTPTSWAEEYLRDIRNRTFHYPRLGSTELRDALKSSSSVRAFIRASGSRPLNFADVVALHASFGDIDREEERARFNEIVSTARHISELLIPITWSALGAHLRSLGIDPHRLRKADNSGSQG